MYQNYKLSHRHRLIAYMILVSLFLQSCGNKKTDRLLEERILANEGNPEEQFNLGLRHEEGRDVPQDDQETVKWYQKAAEQGYVKAQYKLGKMYATGRWSTWYKKNAFQAGEWYIRAAVQGFAKAQYAIGLMYSKGNGVPKNSVIAVDWFKKAAEQGCAKAHRYLNGMHMGQFEQHTVLTLSQIASTKFLQFLFTKFKTDTEVDEEINRIKSKHGTKLSPEIEELIKTERLKQKERVKKQQEKIDTLAGCSKTSQDTYAADNAFNQHKNIRYLYQCSDIRLVGQHLIKSLNNNNITYVGDVGRGHGAIDDLSVFLKNKEKLQENRSLVGVYNTGGNHWIAFRIYKSQEGIVIIYKDSLGEGSRDFEEYTRQALEEGVKLISILGNEQKLEFEPYDPEIGRPAHKSCGIFALKNMVSLAKLNVEKSDEQWFNKEGMVPEFFNPGDNEQQYSDNILKTRKEFAIIYAKETYTQTKAELQARALRDKTLELHAAEVEWLGHLIEDKVAKDAIKTSIETEETINSSDDYHYRIECSPENLEYVEKILAELIQGGIRNMSKKSHSDKYILRFSPTVLLPESYLSSLIAQCKNRFIIGMSDEVEPELLKQEFIQALNIRDLVDITLVKAVRAQTEIDIQIKKEKPRNNDGWGWNSNLTAQPSRKERFNSLKKSRKAKDLEILYEMWQLIRTYKSGERKDEDAIRTIKKISSLSGGANGITYNYADDRKAPYDIRNRYGHIQKKKGSNSSDSPEVRINFEHLYRLNIIIETTGQIPQNLDGVFGQLEKKVLYILAREVKEDCLLKQEQVQQVLKLPEQVGDCEELHDISEFVRTYYDEVALAKIKIELQNLLNFSAILDLQRRDAVYFLARKMVVMGELCNELARDSKGNEKIESDLIKIFHIMYHIRNGFIHCHSKILLDLSHLPLQKLQEANVCLLEFIRDFNNILNKDILKNGVGEANQHVLKICMKNLKKLDSLLWRTTKYKLKHKLERELLTAKNILDVLFSQEYKSLISLYESKQQQLTLPSVKKIFDTSIQEENTHV